MPCLKSTPSTLVRLQVRALELHLPDLQVLLEMSGAPLAQSESDKDLPPELLDPLEGSPAAACNSSPEEASGTPGTSTPATTYHNINESTPHAGVARPLPGASHATTPVKPPVTATGWSLAVSRAPAATTTVPRQRGSTEDNTNKDELGNQMMMMMYKASKQAAVWQREQQGRAEQTCLEDLRKQQA
ncbi:hypothetical protein VP01_944g10 [Puccinia sorghi]|uniref:Uncharacterized protein n=1 Tax=Puccinia sorghi TaxID=27349 RepID=A0A0L6U6M5_9BASI|nr:hypothetical protein VP01_944g10 [Puccinia sorghi]